MVIPLMMVMIQMEIQQTINITIMEPTPSIEKRVTKLLFQVTQAGGQTDVGDSIKFIISMRNTEIQTFPSLTFVNTLVDKNDSALKSH